MQRQETVLRERAAVMQLESDAVSRAFKATTTVRQSQHRTQVPEVQRLNTLHVLETVIAQVGITAHQSASAGVTTQQTSKAQQARQITTLCCSAWTERAIPFIERGGLCCGCADEGRRAGGGRRGGVGAAAAARRRRHGGGRGGGAAAAQGGPPGRRPGAAAHPPGTASSAFSSGRLLGKQSLCRAAASRMPDARVAVQSRLWADFGPMRSSSPLRPLSVGANFPPGLSCCCFLQIV